MDKELYNWLCEMVQTIKDRSSDDEWAFVYADVILDRLREEQKEPTMGKKGLFDRNDLVKFTSQTSDAANGTAVYVRPSAVAYVRAATSFTGSCIGFTSGAQWYVTQTVDDVVDALS